MTAGFRPLRRESAISDPDLALGARLLTHAQPLPKSEARKRRVWNALSSGGSGRRIFKLTALHVAFASVLFAAVSSAAVGHYYVQRQSAEASVSQADALPPSAANRPRSKQRPHAAATRTPLVTPAPEASVATNDSDALRRPPARSGLARSRPAAPDADAELLVEAMRARNSGDAKRVSELTDAYRAKHPQGALQEEALILSIESAATRHAPNTASLARQYLARFPNGRFATQARRALGEGAR